MNLYWLGVATIPLLIGATAILICTVWLIAQTLGFLIGRYLGWRSYGPTYPRATFGALAAVVKRVVMLRLGRHLAIAVLMGDRGSDAAHAEYHRMHEAILAALRHQRKGSD